MIFLRAKAALCFATRGFNFATRKTNLDTPLYQSKSLILRMNFAPTVMFYVSNLSEF